MSKELFMAAHERLIKEYLANHPNADWNEAYEKTADGAYDRMREDIAGLIDGLRLRQKEGRS